MASYARLGALCASLLMACSGSTDGTVADAGTATPAVDAGSTADRVDAPAPLDAPVAADVGTSLDASAPVDASTPVDAVETPDVVAPVDASAPVDVAETPDVAAPLDVTTTCGAGLTTCSNVCVDLQRDPAHCGGCGLACITNEVCNAGRCVLQCPTGQRNCGGTCRDVAVDPAHCGACDSACAEGERCTGGVCQLTCSAGLSLCAGRCRDVALDPAHCGTCDNACAAGQRCEAGVCVTPCAAGQTLCSGQCVDTRTSAMHCGACGNACTEGRSCVAGVCTRVCSSGQTACGDACVSLASSDAHCGACDRACPTGQRCQSGVCTVPTLAPFPVSVYDHSVSTDGSVAMIGRQGNNLLLRCVDGSGAARRADQVVATDANFDFNGSATQVNIGRRSNTVLVTWMALQTPGNYQSRQYFARVYDASCAPVTAAFAWPSTPSSEYVPDVAMADDGRFVVAWKQPDIELAFFDPRGALQGRLTLPTRSVCSGGGYGLHVALNPATGDGVVTCQQHQSNPLYYQRFTASRTLRDAMPVRVEETTSGRSSWYESHIVGMNAQGAFVIEWQNASSRTFEANFYGADGRLVRNVSLGAIGGTQYWDAFRQTHQAVELLGDDFVLRTGMTTQPATVWRYSPAGVRLGCARPGTDLGAVTTLRTDGATRTSLSRSNTVQLNPFRLDTLTACP